MRSTVRREAAWSAPARDVIPDYGDRMDAAVVRM